MLRPGREHERGGNRDVEVRRDRAAGATAAASRGPDANGWYRAPLTISFGQAAGDVSGPDACSRRSTYSGPDAANVVTVRQLHRQGRKYEQPSGARVQVRLDAADRGRVGRSGGRTRTAGSTARSRSRSLRPPATSPGPTPAARRRYLRAGPTRPRRRARARARIGRGTRSAAAAFAFKYDATAPSATGGLARPPDANGWHNHPVALEVTGSDGLSGIASCGGAAFAGPDGKGHQVSGGCTDVAGNPSAPVTRTVDYDATGPVAAAALERGPDVDGWYNHPGRGHGQRHRRDLGARRLHRRDLLGPGRGGADRTGILHGSRREHERSGGCRAQLRRDTSGRRRDAGARAGQQRLVQPPSCRDRCRHRRRVRRGRLHQRVLRRPRHGGCLARRHLPRPGRKREWGAGLAQVRREPSGSRRDAGSPARRGWVVPAAADDLVRRGRRDLGRRLVHRPGSLQRSGQHVGARGRKLPRRGRQLRPRRRTPSSTTGRRRG